MQFSTIFCIDDLTREHFWPAKEFMYDLVRHPIWNASGIDIAKSPRHHQRNNLLPGFDFEHFLMLARAGRPAADWQALYLAIPDAAADYLTAHLPKDALAVGYEMPPWLRAVLDRADVAWLDLRVSPLRFASDLIMALATNRPELYARLQAHSLTGEDLVGEAALMSAQVRHRQRYLPADSKVETEDSWVYIGQTEADASLIGLDGRFVRIADRAQELRALVGTSVLRYRAHPSSGKFAQRELAELERILGRRVVLCDTETYDVLAGDHPYRLVGLSSGTLQEAVCFGRESVSLIPPICAPSFGDPWSPDMYLQIASHRFISEPVWAALLNPEAPRANPVCFPPRPNHLRELHNAWWGYASQTIRHSDFYNQLFAQRAPAAPTARGGDLDNRLREAQNRILLLQKEVQALQDVVHAVVNMVNPAAAPQSSWTPSPGGLQAV